MLLGKVKRVENAFLNLLSKKDNIYLCRKYKQMDTMTLVTTGLLSLEKLPLMENGAKPERLTSK